MRKRYTSWCQQALRFKRWSRKRYAAFVSRQRACTMGTLRCHIVERLQHKNGMPAADRPFGNFRLETAGSPEAESESANLPAGLLPAALAFFVTSFRAAASEAAACAVSPVDELPFTQREVPDTVRSFPLVVFIYP